MVDLRFHGFILIVLIAIFCATVTCAEDCHGYYDAVKDMTPDQCLYNNCSIESRPNLFSCLMAFCDEPSASVVMYLTQNKSCVVYYGAEQSWLKADSLSLSAERELFKRSEVKRVTSEMIVGFGGTPSYEQDDPQKLRDYGYQNLIDGLKTAEDCEGEVGGVYRLAHSGQNVYRPHIIVKLTKPVKIRAVKVWNRGYTNTYSGAVNFRARTVNTEIRVAASEEKLYDTTAFCDYFSGVLPDVHEFICKRGFVWGSYIRLQLLVDVGILNLWETEFYYYK